MFVCVLDCSYVYVIVFVNMFVCVLVGDGDWEVHIEPYA